VRSTFAPLIDTTFRLADGWRSIPVVLSRIDELAPATASTGEHRFSLIFAGTGRKTLPQGIRRLSHPQMDTVALFVVPIGLRQPNPTYQAVINRIS
jgi:hypothetical protein